MNNSIEKSILKRAAVCFSDMNAAPKNLLIFGQGIIAAYIIGFFAYAAVSYNGSVTIAYTELLDMIKASIGELAAGLSVLWCGALVIDTLIRRYGR